MANDKQRVADAKISFAKLMGWTLVAAILMSIVVVMYLSYTSGPLSVGMVVASVLGVFVLAVLGGGLMALGFLSSNSGHDDNAADHRDTASRPGADRVGENVRK